MCDPSLNLKKYTPLQKLVLLTPRIGQDWNIFAYALNKNIITPEGQIDNLYGMIFPLGSFVSKAEAEKEAKRIIEETGHTGIIVARYGSAVPLQSNYDITKVEQVNVDIKGKIIELENERFKEEQVELERQKRLEEDLQQEAEAEENPDTLEYFKRNCYLAIKNYSKYKYLKEEVDKTYENFAKRKDKIIKAYKNNPLYKEQWLPLLEQKLKLRNETNLFNKIKNAYEEIETELFVNQ